LTAYPAAAPDPAKPIPLWPRLLSRPAHQAAIDQFRHLHDPRPHMTSRNIRKILDTAAALGGSIDESMARRLVNLPRQQTLAQWIASLPDRALDRAAGEHLAQTLSDLVGSARQVEPSSNPESKSTSAGKKAFPTSNFKLQASLSYSKTATRRFEIAYWKTIARLASGRLRNKDNADCVQDSVTRSLLRRYQRDLESLGDHLLDYYTRLASQSRMAGRALVGELPFRWETDFDFPWMGGWKRNQEAATRERDIVMVIPGRNRKEAVIMADHYDTAYMENVYDGRNGKKGARLAAAGADDNHSATAALMLGAPVFLALARAGKLDCDIWLVHLTGEEFPSDCMGARWLAQQAVQGSLHLHARDDTEHDLSSTRIRGVYVLDMIAHNNDRARNIFQITPGVGRDSLWLAQQAHHAASAWNAGAERWNRSPERRNARPGRRSPNGKILPRVAKYPTLFDEVRLPIDPRSTLYNTDGQIFSDAGIPVVLFMENYDINRQGYHDTHDTMENIDLDYGAAVAAIAIESVARAATEKPNTPAVPSPPSRKRPKTRAKS
jgi:Zn-dependent M28 family amino/carboxypeptidase